MPTAAPTWKTREALSRRADLVASARAVFAERGYHGATVEAIAERAGVGKGTVYLHFEGGKAALLETVMALHFDRMHGCVVQAAASGGTCRYRFWALALSLSSYFRRSPEALQVHVCELPRLLLNGSPVAALYADLVSAIKANMSEALASCKAAPADSPEAAQAMLGALVSVLIGRLQMGGLPLGRGSNGPHDDADAATALLFDGLASETPPHLLRCDLPGDAANAAPLA